VNRCSLRPGRSPPVPQTNGKMKSYSIFTCNLLVITVNYIAFISLIVHVYIYTRIYI
jgi:hypothetical protein